VATILTLNHDIETADAAATVAAEAEAGAGLRRAAP